MSKPSLQIATSSSDTRRERELNRLTGTAEPKTVSIPLRKMLPMLIDAVESDRAWLKDFSNDLVTIDSDLYEVLLAYSELNKRSAA